jgi:DNA-binding transcriptional LysR family regulator
VSLTEAAGEPLIVIPGIPSTIAMLAACDERGIRPNVVIEADTMEAVRRMVECGLGVSLLPRTMTHAVDSLRLRSVEIGRGSLRRHVALVHRGAAYLSAAARALRETIVEMLGGRKGVHR